MQRGKYILGHAKENTCQAYTQYHRKCRLKASEGERVCSIHSNYFTKWFYSHPPLEENDIENEEKKRKKTEYIDFFRKGCPGHTIHDIMRYVQRIPNTSNYSSFYLFLSEYFYISPLWNMEQFIFMSEEFVRIVFRDGESTDREVLYKYMDILYANPKCIENGWITILMTIITYIYNNTTSVSFRDNAYTDRIMSCILILLEWPGWRSLLKSTHLTITDSIIREKEKNPFIEWIYNEFILPSVETQKNIWIGITQSRCGIIKEELMSELWKPSRVQKLLDMDIQLEDL